MGILGQWREVLKSIRKIREDYDNADDANSPGGAEITATEKEEILADYAEAGRAVGVLVGAADDMIDDVVGAIKKFGGDK